MADNPKPKRRLKPPQTVRERAQASAQQPEQKPKKLSKVKRALSWPFRQIAKPFKKAGKFLARYRLFRIIAKIFKFLAKILLISYIASSWQELKLVTWPNRRETRRLTFAVLAFAVVFGALIASLDFGLSHLFKALILSKNQ